MYTETPIEEKNCSILHDHKDNLCNEDIFFKNPGNLDEAFSSWSGLLGGGSNAKKAAAAPVKMRSPAAAAAPTNVDNGSEETNAHQQPYVKELCVYLDSHVMSIHEKIDVKRKMRLFKF